MTMRKILCLSTLPALLLCGEVAAKDNKSKADWVTNDIKIGSRSQFVTTGTNSAGGATAARVKSRSPSLKATTATRGRPQTLIFKQGRFKN